MFRDVTTLIKDPVGLKLCLDDFYQQNKDMNIDVVINEDFETTNNMESCRLALESFDYEDCIIVNADCIYDDKIVIKMLAAHESCIAIDSSQYCEENMKVSLSIRSSIYRATRGPI